MTEMTLQEVAISDFEAVQNFTSAEFKYVLKKSGAKLIRFVEWYHKTYTDVKRKGYHYFHHRCGGTNISWRPFQVIEQEIPDALMEYLGKDRFLTLRAAFAKKFDVVFPVKEILGVKESVKVLEKVDWHSLIPVY